jgi:hypothetical protein
MSIINKIFRFIHELKNAFIGLVKSTTVTKRRANVLQPILNSSGKYLFYCRGCQANHLISTTPKNGTYHTLSGTLDKPTVRASVLIAGDKNNGVLRCHAFITGGMIKYLDDCTHHLSGKTVQMEPL